MFSCQLKANEHFPCAMRTLCKQTWKVSLNSVTSGSTESRIYFLCKKEMCCIRLQRCIATINRWTDYCNNREIIVSDFWLSQKTLQKVMLAADK